MQRSDLFDVLYEALPQPLWEAACPEMSFSDKIKHVLKHPVPHHDINLYIDAHDMLALISNTDEALQQLPAYDVAHLVALYRGSNEFQRLQAHLLNPHAQITPEEWRVYTYVATAEQLSTLPNEKLGQLRQLFDGAPQSELTTDLQIAHHHITLLKTDHHAPEYRHTLGVIIHLIDNLRQNQNYRRYNLSGIQLLCSIASMRLSFTDLSGSTLYGNSLGVNLSYCNLQNIAMTRYSLTHATLTGANLCGANFARSVIPDHHTRPIPEMTVLGFNYLTSPINQAEIQNRLDMFYRQFCNDTDRLSDLQYIRIVIATELVKAITRDDALPEQTKIEMLQAFQDHPLFGHGQFANSIERIQFMNRLFGWPVRIYSDQQQIIRDAIAELSEKLETHIHLMAAKRYG